MICEFQKQHELDYVDRRKAMNEKNVRTSLDNTVDDIQVATGMQDEVVIHTCCGWHVAGGMQDEVDIHT
jgi:hypothetical protein